MLLGPVQHVLVPHPHVDLGPSILSTYTVTFTTCPTALVRCSFFVLVLGLVLIVQSTWLVIPPVYKVDVN